MENFHPHTSAGLDAKDRQLFRPPVLFLATLLCRVFVRVWAGDLGVSEQWVRIPAPMAVQGEALPPKVYFRIS